MKGFEHSKPDFIKEGAKVYWNDPAIDDYPQEEREDALKRVWFVEDVPPYIGGDTIIPIHTRGSTAEVYASELFPVKN